MIFLYCFLVWFIGLLIAIPYYAEYTRGTVEPPWRFVVYAITWPIWSGIFIFKTVARRLRDELKN